MYAAREPPWSAPPSRRLDWSPIAARPAVWRSSSASPHKRVRLSTPSSKRRAATAELGDFNDEDIRLARSDSVSKLRAVWTAIAQRARDPLSSDEDDVVDLETGEILEDNGFLRDARCKPIGIFAMGGKMRESSTESSYTDSSDHELTNREDELDWLGTRLSLAPALSRSRPKPLGSSRASSVSVMTPLARRLSSQILRDTPVPESDNEDEMDLIETPTTIRFRRSPSRKLMPPPPVPIMKGSTKSVFSPNVPFPTPPPSNSTGSPVALSPPPRKETRFTIEISPPPLRHFFSPSPSPLSIMRPARARSRSVSMRAASPIKVAPKAVSRQKVRESSEGAGTNRRRSVPSTFVTAAEQRARSVSLPPRAMRRASTVSSSGVSTPESSDTESEAEDVRPSGQRTDLDDSSSESTAVDSSDAEREEETNSAAEDTEGSVVQDPVIAMRASLPPVVRYNHRRYVAWTPSTRRTKDSDAEDDFDRLLGSSPHLRPSRMNRVLREERAK